MTNFEWQRTPFVNSSFVIVSSFLIRASSFPLLGPQSCDGICFGGAERGQERGEKTDHG
jgi:hypothetical protein